MNSIEKNNEATAKRRKILVADDDPSIARALATILLPLGETVIVDSGNKAMEVLNNLEVDLIVTDCEMEQGSGLDLLEYLREQNIKTPTIMITAFGTKELILKTMNYHIFGFIEKPFTQEQVESIVRKALRLREDTEKMENLAFVGVSAGEIVHEINNPLTVLDCTISDLEEVEHTDETAILKKSIDRIKTIITTTKDEIRGARKTTKSTFSLNEVLQDAKEEFEYRAEKSNVNVICEGKLEVFLEGERSRIRQIIVNLVNNAIDAASSHKEKWVKITVEHHSKTIAVLVTDSGPGIPNELRERLFEPLFTTKGRNGSGLGLSIVRKIAHEHGGNVYLNTKAANTQFVFVCPEKIHTCGCAKPPELCICSQNDKTMTAD